MGGQRSGGSLTNSEKAVLKEADNINFSSCETIEELGEAPDKETDFKRYQRYWIRYIELENKFMSEKVCLKLFQSQIDIKAKEFFLGLNGKSYKIIVNKWVVVPRALVHILENSTIQTFEREETEEGYKHVTVEHVTHNFSTADYSRKKSLNAYEV